MKNNIRSNVYKIFDFEESTRRTRAVADIPQDEEEIHAGLFLADERDPDGHLRINPSLITLGKLHDYLLPGEENSLYVQQRRIAKQQVQETLPNNACPAKPRTRPEHVFNPQYNIHAHTKKNVLVLNHKKLKVQQEEWVQLRAPVESDDYANNVEREQLAYNRQQLMYISNPDRYLNDWNSPTSRIMYAIPTEHPQMVTVDVESPLDNVPTAHELADAVRNAPFERQQQHEEKVQKFHDLVKQRVARREREKRDVKKKVEQRINEELDSTKTLSENGTQQESAFSRQRIRRMKVHTYSQGVAVRNRKMLHKGTREKQYQERELRDIQMRKRRSVHTPQSLSMKLSGESENGLRIDNQEEMGKTTNELGEGPLRSESSPDTSLASDDRAQKSQIESAETGSLVSERVATQGNLSEQMQLHAFAQKRTTRKFAFSRMTEEERRQLEAKRYLEALREQVIGRCREMKLLIPALCNCGLETFEDRSLCRLNCQFHRDNKGYAKLLGGILYCYGIDA